MKEGASQMSLCVFLAHTGGQLKVDRQPGSTGEDTGSLEPDLWGGDILRRER